MAKIKDDKYYTSIDLAEYCVNRTKDIIGVNNITEWLEPSAGSGNFINFLGTNYKAYDILPEDDRVLKQDYLDLEIPYRKGRCVIGNPPFGLRNNLAVKFFKKSVYLCDYISFILPISQLDNSQKMYEFDLVYSENLGVRMYSGVSLHCCFNIYKRPPSGLLNKTKPKYSFKDVEVIEFRRGSKDSKPDNFDFGMCTWGNGSCGKEISFIGQYAQEHYIIIKNNVLKDRILNICKNTDWRNLCPSISSAKLQTWRIYKYLKEKIPELQ